MTSALTLLVLMSVCSPLQARQKTFETKKYAHKHAKGMKKRFKKSMHAMRISSLIPSGKVPRSLDYSSLFSLPEDQGQCGSCWDFSLTKALRSEYMVAGMDPGSLEFNFLLNNCGPGPKMNGCDGGDFTAAASFEKEAGPGLNSQDPYTERAGKCAHLPVKATAVNYEMIQGDSAGPTFSDLAEMISQKHMVSIDVAAGSGDWENYSGGIYNGCTGTPDDIDHMIDLVGYDCETSIDAENNCLFNTNGRPVNGDGFLIVENNWNEDWGVKAANGHGGYMKTRMYDEQGNHCNAIASDGLVFLIHTPAPAPTVTPTPMPTPVPPAPSCSGFLCSFFGCHLPWCH